MRLFRYFSKRKAEESDRSEMPELEKGDFVAMLIAALVTFAPLVLFISLVYIGVAYLFGL